jgi:hypothetical protein
LLDRYGTWAANSAGPVHQLVGLFRVAGEVGLQELRRCAAELAAELFDGEVEAIADFGANGGEGTGDVERDADLDGIGGVGGGQTAQGEQQRGVFELQHCGSLESARGKRGRPSEIHPVAHFTEGDCRLHVRAITVAVPPGSA